MVWVVVPHPRRPNIPRHFTCVLYLTTHDGCHWVACIPGSLARTALNESEVTMSNIEQCIITQTTSCHGYLDHHYEYTI